MTTFIQKYQKEISLILFLLATSILIANTWVGDDVYITLRTVDNFINGYGLTWNTSERVQTYTHPLWMFLLTMTYLLTNNAYLAAILLSFFISIAVLTLLWWYFRKNIFVVWFILGLLFGSQSFIEFSVSGLENPATHLLLISFLIVFFSIPVKKRPEQFVLLGLFVGLAAFNRMDTILFYIPPLVFVIFKKRTVKHIGLIVTGFIPFVIWEFFSLIYYGSLFPNTSYAKLNTSIPLSVLLQQGTTYYINLAVWDWGTLVTIFASVFMTLRQRINKDLVVMLGVVLYLLYILYIGGDFMRGRFFTAPLIVSVFLLGRVSEKMTAKPQLYLVLLAFTMSLLVFSHTKILQAQTSNENMLFRIHSEKEYYYPMTGLLRIDWNTWPNITPNSKWVDRGIKLKKKQRKVVVAGNVGFLGYFAGPNVHIIGQFALGDPLLARLPISNQDEWFIGHFMREIPSGYRQTILTGENRIKDEALHDYYDKLSMIIHGNVLSKTRLITILEFNIGYYNHLLEEYIKNK